MKESTRSQFETTQLSNTKPCLNSKFVRGDLHVFWHQKARVICKVLQSQLHDEPILSTSCLSQFHCQNLSISGQLHDGSSLSTSSQWQYHQNFSVCSQLPNGSPLSTFSKSQIEMPKTCLSTPNFKQQQITSKSLQTAWLCSNFMLALPQVTPYKWSPVFTSHIALGFECVFGPSRCSGRPRGSGRRRVILQLGQNKNMWSF